MPPSLLASRNDKSMCDRLPIMWTNEEDDILRDQVKLHGIDKWAKIATHLCGKTSRQCRRRWHMFLNVVNKRGGWSAEEDNLLLEAHRKFGNRWTEIAKKLPGRTDNAVKNRFCVLCKRQTKEVGVAPLQRPTGGGSDIANPRLSERRLPEGPKAIKARGANKKMRMAASHSGKAELAAQQTPLEKSLQQWKGLQTSDGLTNSPHQVSKLETVRPWDSAESNVLLQRDTQADKREDWMGLAVEGKGMSSATHLQTQARQLYEQWERSQSIENNIAQICSTTLLRGETRPFKVLQSHFPPVSSCSDSGLMHENSHQWRNASMGDVSSADCLHHHRLLATANSTWLKTTSSAKDLSPKQRPADNDLLQRWKGVEKNIIPNMSLQHRGLDEAIRHWHKNCPDSVSPSSLNPQRSIDENLPPLSEINALAAVHMANSKQCTLDLQRWSTMQAGKGGEHPQQSIVGGGKTWDRSSAKEANYNATNAKPKGNKEEDWQDWNSDEEGNYSPCQDRSLEQIMEIDDPKPDDSAESISFDASVKTLPLWTGPDCQGKASSVMPKSPRDDTQPWDKSETRTNSPRKLLEDMNQWQKSEAAVHPGPLVSMLSRFAGYNSKITSQPRRAATQGGSNSLITEDSWKNGFENSKCMPATSTVGTKLQIPKEVQVFETCLSGGSKSNELQAEAALPRAVTKSCQLSKADDSSWKLAINVKDGGDGGMNTREGMLPENSTSCETSITMCENPNIEVKLTTEEEAPQMTESPAPAIRTGSAHSPSQIVPRSHVTMECMPSPQFSDSEKEFLLSTLAHGQTSTPCWSSSPLRPPSRLIRARNPLFDTRYDTPARSPLSSCLLRQFQVSEAPHRP